MIDFCQNTDIKQLYVQVMFKLVEQFVIKFGKNGLTDYPEFKKSEYYDYIVQNQQKIESKAIKTFMLTTMTLLRNADLGEEESEDLKVQVVTVED